MKPWYYLSTALALTGLEDLKVYEMLSRLADEIIEHELRSDTFLQFKNRVKRRKMFKAFGKEEQSSLVKRVSFPADQTPQISTQL